MGALLLLLVGGVRPLEGQRVRRIPDSLVREVMPGADRFDDVSGDPPVIRAFALGADGVERLLGYVFLTSDLPPEQYGYSGPIEALVGMRANGSLTGVRVTDYQESYRRSMGDFLRTPGFQEQFAGKHIGDPFQLWNDVEGISRVSISVRALSRGVRDSARRVANAYGMTADLEFEPGASIDPVGRSWYELRQLGVVERFEVTEPGEGSAGIALAHIANDRLGEYFLGRQLYERALGSVERRGGAETLVLYAIDGSRLRLFRQQGWSIVQEGDTSAIESSNVVSLGLPSGGVVSGEATMVGLMLVDGSIDAARPFTFSYDLGELGTHEVDYVPIEARIAMAEAEAVERAAAEAAAAEAAAAEAASVEEAEAEAERAAATDPGGVGAGEGQTARDSSAATGGGEGEAGRDSSAATGDGEGEAGPVSSAATGAGRSDSAVAATGDPGAADGSLGQTPSLDFALSADETLLERTLAGTSWGRVALMLFVIGLAFTAFLTKWVGVRWAALAVTLVGLGFLDGGFLSVSHITSGIWVGPQVYLRDVPLLLLVAFTVVTTLIWGRVFCGFLCPFGALQDVLDRVTPDRFKRPLPQAVHHRAIYLKYGVLALIVVPAVAGSQASLYQYFEPFGTVFFLSPSLLLWGIAGAFLVASVVVPRFYCRYACPLGASLALVSMVAPRRIRRVEQCQLCKVCEQKCPTGAIRGPDIDFPECVRCNVCEVQLRDRRGVCGHDMEDIRPRLVQLHDERGGALAGVAAGAGPGSAKSTGSSPAGSV